MLRQGRTLPRGTVASTTAASASEAEEAESPTGVAVALEGLRNLDPTLILPSAADVGQEVVDKLIPVGSGAVQMLTTVAGDQAPTRYDYDLHLAPGQTLSLAQDGVLILNPDGSIALVISSAWAKDANGPQITAAFASGTIWGGLGRAALACALGR